MPDTQDQTAKRDGNDDAPMTLLAVNQAYWLYEGKDLLNDMLFGRGAYPFKVKCYVFENIYDLRRFTGEAVSVASFWHINPDIVDRLRRDDLLIEIFSPDG